MNYKFKYLFKNNLNGGGTKSIIINNALSDDTLLTGIFNNLEELCKNINIDAYKLVYNGEPIQIIPIIQFNKIYDTNTFYFDSLSENENIITLVKYEYVFILMESIINEFKNVTEKNLESINEKLYTTK
jgi:hypothetical protein